MRGVQSNGKPHLGNYLAATRHEKTTPSGPIQVTFILLGGGASLGRRLTQFSVTAYPRKHL